MSEYKTTMTKERARSVMPKDIVYRYKQPWLVIQTDDRTQYGRTGRHFFLRLGSSGTMGHEHWGFWEDYDVVPHQ